MQRILDMKKQVSLLLLLLLLFSSLSSRVLIFFVSVVVQQHAQQLRLKEIADPQVVTLAVKAFGYGTLLAVTGVGVIVIGTMFWLDVRSVSACPIIVLNQIKVQNILIGW
jgi:hypothetical protein